jgi:low affinity Fe/Cu permease
MLSTVVRRVHCKTLMHERFRRLSRRSSEIVGSAEMFLAACVTVVMWAVLGPRYGFSDTWQLVINTGTTIVTFLMVFIIQNAQNRDARAMQLKLDELIRAVKDARTGMVRLEEMTDQDLCALEGDFKKLRSRLAAAHQEPSVSSMTKRPAINVRPGDAESMK